MTTPGTSAVLRFFATCPRNTEGLLLDELTSLGVTNPRETRSGVSFHATIDVAYRTCLWSRIASRVLLRLQAVTIASADDLYEAVREYTWEDHLSYTSTLAVDVTSAMRQGPLAQVNTHYLEQRVKDGVVDQFRDRTGSRPGVDLARPNVRINVHLAADEAVISLDLSGDGLHRRGYRLEGGEAPLKENLAAAILLRAGWPSLAVADAPLLDPMCGSGTLLIEGALMAADPAPGLQRKYFGFQRWPDFQTEVWNNLLGEAQARRNDGLKRLPLLFGYDIDRRAVSTAQANARRAGLAGRINLAQRGLDTLSVPHPKERAGMVVTNPPYGKRLGDVAALVPLYETLGERLKAQFAGWEAAVFTGNPELASHLGLRAHRVNVLYNGPIECKLLQFRVGMAFDRAADKRPGLRPGFIGPASTIVRGPTGAHVTTTTADVPSQSAEMFANRLAKNAKRLRRWATREDVHCYRLYDADLPEYAAAIDLYEDWLHVQEYAPPRSVDPVAARRRLKDMLLVAPQVLELPSSHVVHKVRQRQRGSAQYERQANLENHLEVREGGLRFLVNLSDYLDTGLFLDHRPIRSLIRQLSAGKRFLNLFAYTGTATVYAADGGAALSTTVDLSANYLRWARRNLELNGLLNERHRFVRADCLSWLKAASPSSYDLIFLDAPTFSNSKSMNETLDIQRDHAHLIRAAGRLLAAEGMLLFSTNFRRFRLDDAVSAQFAVRDITKQTVPPDFARNPHIHSSFQISHRVLDSSAARGAR